MAVLGVRCNPDVAPRRNCGGVAYFWNAMSVDFQYVDVYVIHDDDDDDDDDADDDDDDDDDGRSLKYGKPSGLGMPQT